jgi:hypothetical protein
VLAIAGLLLAAAGIWAHRQYRRSADVFAHRGEDIAQLNALFASTSELDTSVLEARGGMALNFDDIDRAVLSLRPATRTAATIQGRGANYAEAAEAIVRAADQLRGVESQIETLKTDLALLRLSSRYFPIAAGALSRPDEASVTHLNALRADFGRFEGTGTPEVGWRISNELAGLDAVRKERELRTSRVNTLRADVERYQEIPTREVAQRLEGEIGVLEESRAFFAPASRGDLDVLLGHTRAILDRRERVDRTARAVVHSSLRTDLEQARASYERSSRRDFVTASVLRVAAGELWAAALGLLAAAGGMLVVRRRHIRSATAG